jgi:hypothetical protein
MARRAFFSFHFNDSWRANQVRMSNIVGGADLAGFYDHSLYEENKRGAEAIRREILKQLEGTSATVVLIGTQTAERRWVDFEIRESIKRDNGLVGIAIHHLIAPPWPGAPWHLWRPSQPGRRPAALPPDTPVYMWDPKNRAGFARVIEEAAQRGERLKAAKREGQLRALLAMKAPPAPRAAPPPPTLADAIRQQYAMARIARLLTPPPAPPPSPGSLEALLSDYRMRRIFGGSDY